MCSKYKIFQGEEKLRFYSAQRWSAEIRCNKWAKDFSNHWSHSSTHMQWNPFPPVCNPDGCRNWDLLAKGELWHSSHEAWGTAWASQAPSAGRSEGLRFRQERKNGPNFKLRKNLGDLVSSNAVNLAREQRVQHQEKFVTVKCKHHERAQGWAGWALNPPGDIPAWPCPG